jgi:hypothetical protein
MTKYPVIYIQRRRRREKAASVFFALDIAEIESCRKGERTRFIIGSSKY